MSAAKETPRQKMIGMMYLVLTALLALQVSNAVLEKFIFMNKSLERMATDYEEKNIVLPFLQLLINKRIKTSIL